jgi:hypothetical protein
VTVFYPFLLPSSIPIVLNNQNYIIVELKLLQHTEIKTHLQSNALHRFIKDLNSKLIVTNYALKLQYRDILG